MFIGTHLGLSDESRDRQSLDKRRAKRLGDFILLAMHQMEISEIFHLLCSTFPSEMVFDVELLELL